MTVVEVAPPGDPGAASSTRFLIRPPGLVFHLVLGFFALLFLCACSFPGFDFYLFMLAAGSLFVAAIVWSVWLAIYAVQRVRGRTDGRAWWWLGAPLGGFLVLGLVYANVPLRVRFAASEPAFSGVVHELQRKSPDVSLADRRLGLFNVTTIQRVPHGGVLFYEENGACSTTRVSRTCRTVRRRIWRTAASRIPSSCT